MNKTHTTTAAAALFFTIVFLASCEKPDFDIYDDGDDGTCRTELHITGCDDTSFGSAQSGGAGATACSDLFTRLNTAVYSDGERVSSVSQTADDEQFGSPVTALEPGRYLVVVMAHSGEGNATTTDASHITFKSNKTTDTFFYADSITVTESGIHDIVLTHCVARVKLSAAAQMPAGTTQLKFYYTGGSSTFSAIDRAGIVNSRQTEIRQLSPDGTYYIYTFPRPNSDALKITVTALDQSGTALAEKVFENVPIYVARSTDIVWDAE